jgi:hypothetical protein
MYIYVNGSNDKLYGIISIGDFKKYFRVNHHLNTNFLSVREGNHLEQDVDKIVQKNNRIQEIPVLDIEGRLLYVKKRKRHIVNDFNFDWTLCSAAFIEQFFEGSDHVCYLSQNEKIQGLREVMVPSIKMKQLNSIKECGAKDVLLVHNECLEESVRAYHIDEVYLTILSRTTVCNFMMNGIQYLFFQTPVEWKCRKENLVYYLQGMDDLAADTAELVNIFGDYADAIKYWTEHDYKNVMLCEANGRYLLEDVCSQTYHVQNNQRVTWNQPVEYSHTIYVLGTCIARGFGVSDDLTIPSMLQAYLNREGFTQYRVVNYGTGGGLNVYSDIRDFVNINRTDVKKNDIVIHLGYNCWEMEKSRVEFDHYYELSWLFNRRHKKRCFINWTPHLTAYANEVASEYIFRELKTILF